MGQPGMTTGLHAFAHKKAMTAQVLHEQIKYCFIEIFFSSIQQESIMATIKCA